MEIVFSALAQEHLLFWKHSGNKKIMLKIEQLFISITQTPFEGLGKPEPLKHQFTGFWSRRINQEHRLVYRLLNDIVIEVASLRFHY